MKFVAMGILAVLAGASSAVAVLPQVQIVKSREAAKTRIFNPAHPPADMPPIEPPETAECDSEFLSDASVAGEARLTDATHAELKITKVIVKLQLNIVIWLPAKSFKKLEEHEKGHQKISEIYYKHADLVARRIAEPYIGKIIPVSGPDLRKAVSEILEQMGTQITGEYVKQIPVETTQARYDEINQHGVKDISAADSMAQALKETYNDPSQTDATKP